MASLTAFFVISLKRTRWMLGLASRTSSAMCQAMASPSRSGSGASSTLSTFLAAALISASTFFLPSMTSYWGAKPCSMSIPMVFLGRSLTCPTEAFTTYPGPRYFLIVVALAGDSTMTRALSPSPRRDFFFGASPAPSGVASAGAAATFALGFAAFVLVVGAFAVGAFAVGAFGDAALTAGAV